MVTQQYRDDVRLETRETPAAWGKQGSRDYLPAMDVPATLTLPDALATFAYVTEN